MIKLKLLLVEINNGKKFEYVDKLQRRWIAIVSPAIKNSSDNPNEWPFRVSLFLLKGKTWSAEDHQYLGSDKDDTVISTLNRYPLGP